jgi:arylsulfatase
MLIFLLLLACGGGPQPEPAAESVVGKQPPALPSAASSVPKSPNIVLITLDTTRADALGVYGGPDQASPRIDALAGRGARFEWALSHVATTLSAHASMFTGLDPHGHRVPRNGFPLEDSHETLAERLSGHGYDTIATIGASVINREMGMGQGFRLFDERTPKDMGPRYEDLAEGVTDRALSGLEQADRSKPLFFWVHYYDAHTPYRAPSSFRARFVDPGYQPTFKPSTKIRRLTKRVRAGTMRPVDLQHLRNLYQAEVAYVDHQVGRLLDGLQAQGVLENAIVVLTADHGDMFAETKAQPLGHGAEIDTFVTRVPLIIVRTGGKPIAPQVIQQPVKLSDLAATILSLGELGGTMGTGQDLSGLMQGGAMQPDPIYLEATKPKKDPTDGSWNNATKERGVISRGHLLVVNSQVPSESGLFVLAPTQPRAENPEVQAHLQSLLDAWDAGAPRSRTETLSDETREALQALGYME